MRDEDEEIAAYVDRLLSAEHTEKHRLLTSEEGRQFVERVYSGLVYAATEETHSGSDVSRPSATATFFAMYALVVFPDETKRMLMTFLERQAYLIDDEPPEDSNKYDTWDQSLRDLNIRYGFKNLGVRGRRKGSKNKKKKAEPAT